MKAEELLNEHHLKSTGIRKLLLNLLIERDFAISEHEIKENLGEIYDRVTIYRTLKTLEECGIIHKISHSDCCTQYSLNRPHKNENHSHFHCCNCHNIICLENQATVSITLPQGFTETDLSIVINGLCPKCSKGK